MKIQLKHSNVLDTGAAKQPTAPNMLDGEIAVNFNATDPAIFIKNSDGNIVRIAGKDNLSFTGYETSIQAAATPPSGLVAGNLYFDTDDNRLYYYYDNGTTQQWVDASTEKFDVTIIPDPTNLNHQSGTLDDRYVNSNGDTMTGNLVLNAGVNLNSSDVYLNNGKVVFEGANANAHEIRLTVVEPTADRVISLPDVTGTLVSTGDSGTVTSGMIADGTIQNSDVSNSAAIGLSKLATGALPSGITVASTNIVNGTIVDADINSSAAIALTKLGTGALPSGITIASSGISGGVSPTDIAAGALPNNVTVVSANIVDGSIVNADISNTASIQVSKLADGNSYQLLQTNAAGNGVEWTSNIDVPGTLDVTGISTFDDNLTVAGNLAVTGSTVSLDANIVTVKDGNIQLGVVSTPTDVTADGGGITLKGSTDKTLSWINSTDAWTSSEHFNLATGKAYYVNGSEVLNGSSLGSSVTGSSLTGLGTISSGVWQGTQIVDTYLATITGTGKVANSATSATNLNSGNAIVSRDGSGDFTARNVTAALIGNASTASALENARTIALTGDLTGSASFDGSSNISISTTATFTGTTNLTYNSTTRKVESDTGTDATIPLFSNTVAGLAGASGGGTVNYLRADGSWASPPGTATNLGYTAATSTITSSTGTGVAIPNFSSTNAGFVQGSGGGTTKFLRADGNWIALGSSSTSIGTSPPSNPNAGDSWFDTDEGRTYIYYQDTDSSQWVESNPSWNGGIPTGSVTPGYLSTGGPNWDASGNLSATGSITAASGVISGSLTQGGNNVVTVGDTGTVTSTMILDGTIVNTDISSAAAIALNKLASGALPSAITIGSSNIVNGTIVDADISTSAAISLSKLSSGALPSNITVTSSNISDLSIVNNDINASAAIAGTKVSPNFGSQNVVTTGSLGVGTSSPGHTLEVKGSFPDFAIVDSDTTNDKFRILHNGGGTQLIVDPNNVGPNASYLLASIDNSERMRIDSSGRLLVGTTAGAYKLVVSGGVATTGIVASILNPVSGGNSKIHFSDNATYNWTAGTVGNAFAITPTEASTSAGTPALFINSSGNVGVGTTSPGGYGNFADDLVVYNSSQPGITLATGTSGYGSIYFADGTVGNALSRGQIQYNHNDDSLLFASAASERLRIDSSGRLLVGTSSSQAANRRFQIAGTDASGAGMSLCRNTNNNDGSYIDFIKSRNATYGSNTIVQSGDTIGKIQFRADDGTDYNSQVASITAAVDGTPGANDMPGRLVFATTIDGASSPSERMRIDSSGRLLVSGEAALTSTSLPHPVQIAADWSAQNIVCFGRASDDISAIDFYEADKTTNLGEIQYRPDHVNFRHRVGDIRFATGGVTERMRIDSSGRVGIGETSMDALLVIKGNSDANTTPSIRLKDGTDTREAWITNTAGDLVLANGGNDNVPHCVLKMMDGNFMSFHTANTERMRIDSSGNVGIGTSSPAQKFHVLTQGTSGGIIAQFENSDSGNYGGLRILGGVTDRECRFQSLYGNSFFTFYTEGAGAAEERMRIDSSGDFMVGQTNGSSGTQGIVCNANGLLSVCTTNTTTSIFNQNSTSGTRNLIVFRTDGTDRGSITSNGSSTSYNTTSDYRLKENIIDLDGAITRVKQLQPKRFNFIADDTTTVDGFLAHEAQTVVPEAVTGTKDEVDADGNAVMQGIDQAKLVPLLTAALQEAIAKIETLEQRLTDAGIA